MAGIETLAAIALAGSGKFAYNAASDVVKAWIAGKQDQQTVSAEQIGTLVSQYIESREKYLGSNPDPTASVERRRADLLKQISGCQNRILFEVSDPDLIARLVPFAIEQTTSLYGISKEAEFAIVEMGVGQLDSILARNAANIQLRNRHRSLAISMTVGVIVLIVALIASSSFFGVNASTVVPLISIPLPIILWSVLGSLGAMLYRFNTSADAELADPLRWSFTRPLTGILMGIIAYMVFKVGILVLQPAGDIGSTGRVPSGPSQELLWLAAFLAGFSDRFADTVLRSLAGRLGGDRQAELVTVEKPPSTTFTMSGLAEKLGIGRKLPAVEDVKFGSAAVARTSDIGPAGSKQVTRPGNRGTERIKNHGVPPTNERTTPDHAAQPSPSAAEGASRPLERKEPNDDVLSSAPTPM